MLAEPRRGMRSWPACSRHSRTCPCLSGQFAFRQLVSSARGRCVEDRIIGASALSAACRRGRLGRAREGASEVTQRRIWSHGAESSVAALPNHHGFGFRLRSSSSALKKARNLITVAVAMIAIRIKSTTILTADDAVADQTAKWTTSAAKQRATMVNRARRGDAGRFVPWMILTALPDVVTPDSNER